MYIARKTPDRLFDSCGGLQNNAELRALTRVLLSLYGAARTCGVEVFQRSALELLSELIPSDCGWWGRASFNGVAHRVHCSHLHRLPDDLPDLLNLSDPNNFVANKATRDPGRAHYFGPQDWVRQASTAALAEHMGIHQALCIALPTGAQAQVNFLSIGRATAEPTFNVEEQYLLELLMPHFTAALDLCCVTQMGRLHKGDDISLLTTDIDGWIHVAEAGVDSLLRREWPQWTSAQLPAPLTRAIAGHQPRFIGRKLRADIHWSGDHALVTLRRPKPADILTRQEHAVAEAFATGMSYKMVAETLCLSPSTVRHHLRAAYLKLGVSDKAALTRQLQ